MRSRSCAALLLFLTVPVAAQDFPRIFGARYQEATAWVLERAKNLCAVISAGGADPRLLVPVVFPEVLRYSLIRDRLETVGLETLYVSHGTSYADFSIGRFQMKPSFIEKLERRLPALGVYEGAVTARAVRAQRVARLRDESWQERYLAGFGSVAEAAFPRAGMEMEERIRFLATAYNFGFWRTAAEIEEAESWTLFPNGARQTSPYRYADVAVDFYQRIWKAACEGMGVP